MCSTPSIDAQTTRTKRTRNACKHAAQGPPSVYREKEGFTPTPVEKAAYSLVAALLVIGPLHCPAAQPAPPAKFITSTELEEGPQYSPGGRYVLYTTLSQPTVNVMLVGNFRY